MRAGARDLLASGGGALRGAPRAALLLGLVAAAGTLFLGSALFGLGPLHGALALLAAVPLAALCGRAAGQTDVSPAGQVSQLAQGADAPLSRGHPRVDVAAAAVVSGEAAQTGVTLWSLKAGHLLGASARAQGVAALAGTALGALISAVAYEVVVRSGALARLKLAVPNAQQWRTIAELAATGAAALPPGAGTAAAIGLIAGVLLALGAGTRAARFVPDATALGIGMLLPVHAAAAAVVGALGLALWAKARPAAAERFANVTAAGLVAGESIAGLAVAIAGLFAAPK